MRTCGPVVLTSIILFSILGPKIPRNLAGTVACVLLYTAYVRAVLKRIGGWREPKAGCRAGVRGFYEILRWRDVLGGAIATTAVRIHIWA